MFSLADRGLNVSVKTRIVPVPSTRFSQPTQEVSINVRGRCISLSTRYTPILRESRCGYWPKKQTNKKYVTFDIRNGSKNYNYLSCGCAIMTGWPVCDDFSLIAASRSVSGLLCIKWRHAPKYWVWRSGKPPEIFVLFSKVCFKSLFQQNVLPCSHGVTSHPTLINCSHII